MKKLACLLALAACFTSAHAAPVYLALTGGAYSSVNGPAAGYPDTYVESGFRIQMVRAGDHMDPGYLGDIGFHNGSLNPDNIAWRLDYFGAAFNLVDINIAAITGRATSFTLTGSNGATQTISSLGTVAILGMGNVTSVTFNIDQDGSGQSVGLSAMNVDTSPVPLPGTLALFGLGAAALGAARRRKA